MKTKIRKVSEDMLIVDIEGRLSFEESEPLRGKLTSLIRKNQTDETPKKVIFNLEKLEFVGSSGISSFVQTLKDFNTTASEKPRYCHVKSEFKKIIRAFDDGEAFEFFETEDRAKKSFDQ